MTEKATPARKGPTQPPKSTIRPLTQESFDAWLERLRILVEEQHERKRLMVPFTFGESENDDDTKPNH